MTHEAPSPESLLEHREWLRAIARSLVRDENVVDDVEQRTWLTVLHNRRPVTSARGWLRRVVKSAAIDEHRSDTRRRAREAETARPEGLPATDHLVMEVEAQRVVAQAVAGLPEPYRTTVLLRYIEELPVRDVALRMGVPVKTVETRLRRALALLREALDREFGDRRAWSVLLLPLAKDRPPIPIGAATAGAIVMAAKTKAALAVAALVLLATGIVWTVASNSDSASAPETDTSTAADASASSREQAAGPKFAVAGRVRSRLNGRAVAGAHVTLGRATRGTSADTADDGTFRIEGGAAGKLRVEARRFRAADVEVAAPSDGAEVADLGDVWLDGSATLLVEVKGPRDAVIADAEVTLVRRRHHGEIASANSYLRDNVDPAFGRTMVGSVKSGTDGIARFAEIQPGGHELVVRAPGFAMASSGWVEVPPEREETRTTVRVSPAHRIRGRVVTATGEPAAGRLVDAGAMGWDERGFARTDADGRFALDDVAAGDVTLSVGRTRGSNPVVAVVRVPDVDEVELRLPPTGAVAGRVTLPDGSPVADAEVGVATSGSRVRAEASARTDADGCWRIEEMPEGRLGRFEVRHPGLYHVGPRLEGGVLHDRRSGGDAGVDAGVPAGGELRLDVTMAKGARLHGRVTGPDGGVAGAWVYLHLRDTKAGQEWETAVSDSDGRYEFDFLPPGPAAAVPLHPALVHPDMPKELGTSLAAGKLPASLTFELPEGGELERDFTLLPGARVAGRVTGPSGAPVEGATVRVDATSYSSPPTPVAVTDAVGAFVLDSVNGLGTSKLRVEARGLTQAEVPDVELKPGARVEGIEVRMSAAPRVTGHVLDADGAPVVGARVTLTRPGVRSLDAWTDAMGGYAADVPWNDGKVTVDAFLEETAAGRAEGQLTPGGATVDVRLAAPSDIAGRVTDASGSPVAGAVVSTLSTRNTQGRLMWNYGDLYPWGEQTVVRTTTDGDGRFRVALAEGPWAVVVRHDGFVDRVAAVTVPGAGGVDVKLDAATTLAGTLRGDDGKPLADAVVVLVPGAGSETPGTTVTGEELITVLQTTDHRYLRRTDASGAFRFPGIADDDYTLAVYVAGPTRRRPRETRFGPLRPSSGPYAFSLAAPLTNSLAGRIVDAGGAAYRDANITISVIEESTTDLQQWETRKAHAVAGTDGSFRIDGLTAPSYALQVMVQSDQAPAVAPAGATYYRRSQRRVFRGLRPPSTELVLEMTESPRLRGRLVDEAGAPLRDWTVTAAPSRDLSLFITTGRTGDDGTFEIRDVEDADYHLDVRLDGQATRRVLLRGPVRGGSSIGDVVATLEARLRGRVVDKGGAAVAGAKVVVWPILGGSQTTVTSAADGTFEVTGLDPDELYLAGLIGANGKFPWENAQPPSDGIRPGKADLRLVRE